MTKVSFSTFLDKLDEHLRQQLKEYKFQIDLPDAPVNEPPAEKKRPVKKQPKKGQE